VRRTFSLSEVILKRIIFLLFVLALIGCTAANDPAAQPTGPLLATVPSLSELAGTPPAEIPPLPTLDPAEIALGQQIYDQHCAVCHGINLEGEADWKTPNEDGSFRAPPHTAEGHTWHHSDKVLLETIRLGGARLPASIGATSSMPAYEDILTQAEMTAVLTFIKSTWPEDIRQMQWNGSHQ
jgi:mono/diheme cytochrome c family protein